MAISETGIWGQEEADEAHIFSFQVAKWISEHIQKEIPVFDLGCGNGSYVHYLKSVGFKFVYGFEGSELNNFQDDKITICDLTKKVDFGGVGNVICLELFEHIKKEYESQLIENIIRPCSNKLIISCAVPNQQGLGHVNCRDNIYIIDKFQEQGFKLNTKQTLDIRSVVEEYVSYFRNTLLIFDK